MYFIQFQRHFIQFQSLLSLVSWKVAFIILRTTQILWNTRTPYSNSVSVFYLAFQRQKSSPYCSPLYTVDQCFLLGENWQGLPDWRSLSGNPKRQINKELMDKLWAIAKQANTSITWKKHTSAMASSLSDGSEIAPAWITSSRLARKHSWQWIPMLWFSSSARVFRFWSISVWWCLIYS